MTPSQIAYIKYAEEKKKELYKEILDIKAEINRLAQECSNLRGWIMNKTPNNVDLQEKLEMTEALIDSLNIKRKDTYFNIQKIIDDSILIHEQAKTALIMEGHKNSQFIKQNL